MYTTAFNLSADIEQAYRKIQEISEEIDEFGETPERVEELALANQALLHYAEESNEFLVACQDLVDKANAEADRLKEKANRIMGQSKAQVKKADSLKKLMTAFLESYHPEGVRTDEGKFYLGKSYSLEVSPVVNDSYEELSQAMRQYLTDLMSYAFNGELQSALRDRGVAMPDIPTSLLDPLISDVKVQIMPNKSAIKKTIKEEELPGFSIQETTYVRLSRPRN